MYSNVLTLRNSPFAFQLSAIVQVIFILDPVSLDCQSYRLNS
jgi:hypothetical protein